MALPSGSDYRVTKIGTNLGYKKILRNIMAWTNFQQACRPASAHASATEIAGDVISLWQQLQGMHTAMVVGGRDE
jgi:uncharacterized protein YijF (DUF1287 family)